MKMLAEVEEMLEDYDKIIRNNNTVCRTIIINSFNDFWYKVGMLHMYKRLLEENDIPHDYDDFGVSINDEGQRVADSYIDNLAKRLGEKVSQFPEAFPVKQYDVFEKYIEPLLLKDNISEEEDDYI